MLGFRFNAPAPVAPPPPLLDPRFWGGATLETKLIAAFSLALGAHTLLRTMTRKLEARTLSSPGEAAAASPVRATTSKMLFYAPITGCLLVLLMYPGSIDTLRMLLWSPENALVVPPGVALVVLGSALTLAVSFTSAIFHAQQRGIDGLEGDPSQLVSNGSATAATSMTGSATAITASTPSADLSAAAVADLCKQRRSIFPKDFSGAPVPRAAIERALDAANWAPTHGKTEPWRFAVFYGSDALARLEELKAATTRRRLADKPEELSAAVEKMSRKRKDVAKCAAVVALVCKRVAGAKGKLMPEWEDQAAVACAVQNFHLTLTAEGYHGYWSSGGVDGWANDDEVRKLVGADGAQDRVLGWFHIGVCERPEAYKARRGPLTDKVHWIVE